MELKTKYLPVSTKKEIVKMVVDNCIYEKDGMKFVDVIKKKLSIDLALVNFYGSEDLIDIDMDELYETGKFEELKDTIPLSEIYFIEYAVDSVLEEEKEIYNSLSATVLRCFNKLISKMPDVKDYDKLLKKLPKVLDSISPENKEIFKGIIEGNLK